MAGVSGLASAFERKKHSRVVMSGHGLWFPAHGKITVPANVTIHFYVRHGEMTSNAIGMAVENRFASTAPPTPVESFSGGDEVWNYSLTFGSRLNLGGSLDTYKYDWITVDDVDRAVRLSVLLRDTRCKAPCEIHWAAFREVRHGAAPGRGGSYLTRSRSELETTGKSLTFIGEDGVPHTHTATIPKRV